MYHGRRVHVKEEERKENKKVSNTLDQAERKVYRNLEEFGDYWENRSRKLREQAVPAQSHLFDKCVFFILGFVGRGEESRYAMTKMIEKNGGRTVLMISAQVTHVVADHLCQSKRNQLDKAIEKRKIVVVKPEYVFKCVNEQKLLDPTPYLSSKPKTRSILELIPYTEK